MRTTVITLVITLSMTPILVDAARLTIKPGLWESTMTRTNPMTGNTTTETTTECIDETVFEPSRLVENSRGCELVKNELDGNTLNFSMECSLEGTESRLDGSYRTDGDKGDGHIKMTMMMGGQEITMDMEWTARRLEDC